MTPAMRPLREDVFAGLLFSRRYGRLLAGLGGGGAGGLLSFPGAGWFGPFSLYYDGRA